jgi:glucuronosyltransferase
VKTKLFFTHGGFNGALETIWHGIPQVVLPVFVDQLDVAHMLVRKGVAVLLDRSFNADQFQQAMETVLNDPR